MEKGSRYIKYGSIAVSLTGIILISLFFSLEEQGVLKIIDYSWTENCAGTDNDLCKYSMDFYNNQTWYLQKHAAWLNTTPSIKSMDMMVKWGNHYRKIPIETGCSGSWCGCSWCKYGITARYAFKFKDDRFYTVEWRAKKHHPRDVINWNINPEGKWDVALATKTCDYRTITYNISNQVYINYTYYNKTEGRNVTVMKYNGSKVTSYTRQECIKGTDKIIYADDTFEHQKDHKGCQIFPSYILCDDDNTADGNGDGICQSGETCYNYSLIDKIELTEVKNGNIELFKKKVNDNNISVVAR